MQSFRCCHLLDVHVEHVHSVCCARALRMCHLCEDTARAGGGIFTHHTLTFTQTLQNMMPRYRARRKNLSPSNEISLTFCASPRFTQVSPSSNSPSPLFECAEGEPSPLCSVSPLAHPAAPLTDESTNGTDT